ncbi:uncharacterized protein LOC112489586 [Ziziphus jujuba]|uniref:Uncharacterized protein LOC112489586 n=1 Tax=Ziziphus jujuba TaxID=326968 RepID=A0ABM4A8B0_ZIZJJ|nr:uncharacterized protein LOC112489586 [Ziziphus jujuba]
MALSCRVTCYQIDLRYTGGAHMLLMLSLKFGIIPLVAPIGVRDFDIDGELWVKLRLIPTKPFVGAVSWAFVALPKIKFMLSPFRLFNLMGGFVNIREAVGKVEGDFYARWRSNEQFPF